MLPQIFSPSQSLDPIEQDRIESGRPSSRLEVQQSLLNDNRQRSRDLSVRVKPGRNLQLSLGWLGKPVDGSRRLVGQLLLSVGQRVYPGTA